MEDYGGNMPADYAAILSLAVWGNIPQAPPRISVNLPPDMLPAFAGLHILTEENRKRLSSFG